MPLYNGRKEKIMLDKSKKDKKIINKIKEWLDDNVEEQSLPLAVRQDSARLRDKIEEWEKEKLCL